MKYLLLLLLASCASTGPALEFNVSQIPACKASFNKGSPKQPSPPDQFLKDTFEFVKENCSNDVLFGANKERYDGLGVWGNKLGVSESSSRKRRCAGVFELMRGTAAFESTFRWHIGIDTSKSSSLKKDLWAEESGIFQTSPNSHVYSCPPSGCLRFAYLDNLTESNGIPSMRSWSKQAAADWISAMKQYKNKELIMHHFVFMLRHKMNHYGTLLDKKNRTGANIQKGCVDEVEKLL